VQLTKDRRRSIVIDTTLDGSVRPLAGMLGAEVTGVDLRRQLDDATVRNLRSILDRYLVLFFPDQDLTDDEHLAFALRFGVSYVHPIGRTAGRTAVGVEHIVDDVEHPPYQDRWHTDVSWDTTPPTYGTLRAIELPSRGGDTIWANMYAAYDALSPTMQQMIEPLQAIHDMGAAKAFVAKTGADLVARTREQFPGTAHPVVGVHPSTGRRYLNVNSEFTREIVGLHEDESAPVLRLLTERAKNPNFQHRHVWRPGDFAIWDERCTQHFAVADYLPERRELGRVAVA
jgi:taurine dioxygenase